MYVLHRNKLQEFLTTVWDPDRQNQEEMRFFSEIILANSRARRFLLSDNENGDDPEVGYPEYVREFKSLGTGDCEGGYYGCNLQTNPSYEAAPKVFNCYLGGSLGNSAPGFVVTEVEPA